MKAFFKSATVLAALLLPFAASADCGSQGLCKVLNTIGDLIGILTPLAVAVSLLAFFWGLAMFMLHMSGPEGDKDRNKARGLMIYGIITLFVIVSVWGLVRILEFTVFGNSNPSSSPQIPYIIHP